MIMYRGEAGFESNFKYEVWNSEFAKKVGIQDEKQSFFVIVLFTKI